MPDDAGHLPPPAHSQSQREIYKGMFQNVKTTDAVGVLNQITFVSGAEVLIPESEIHHAST